VIGGELTVKRVGPVPAPAAAELHLGRADVALTGTGSRFHRLLTVMRVLSIVVGLTASGIGLYRVLNSNNSAQQGRPAVTGLSRRPPVTALPSTQPSGAVSTGQPSTGQPAPATSAVTCVNHAVGFLVKLPTGWRDYSTSRGTRCESLDTSAGAGGSSRPVTAITITPITLSYAGAVSTYTHSASVTLLSKRAANVAGVPAVRVEFARVGDPNPTARTYAYVVDHGTAILIEAYSADSANFAATKAAVDAIAASFEFFT
jgi:hypothetical protein